MILITLPLPHIDTLSWSLYSLLALAASAAEQPLARLAYQFSAEFATADADIISITPLFALYAEILIAIIEMIDYSE